MSKLGMRAFTLEQRETLRAALEARAQVLRDELGEDLHKDLNEEPELAEAKRDADELRAVEDALARLDQADYGRCSACRADIPFQRLKANPAARLCVACQDRQEHAAHRRPA